MNDFVQVSWPPAPPTTQQPAGTLNKKNNWDLTPITDPNYCNCFLSLGDAQEHRQATFDLHQCIRVDVPEGWSYLVALHRHSLVHHHL